MPPLPEYSSEMPQEHFDISSARRPREGRQSGDLRGPPGPAAKNTPDPTTRAGAADPTTRSGKNAAARKWIWWSSGCEVPALDPCGASNLSRAPRGVDHVHRVAWGKAATDVFEARVIRSMPTQQRTHAPMLQHARTPSCVAAEAAVGGIDARANRTHAPEVQQQLGDTR